MSELLYIKYNSHRKPEYQVSTRIVSKNGIKSVIKSPSTDEAEKQIDAIKKNYKLLKNYYKFIKVIPFRKAGRGVSFEFVEGTPVLEGINFERDSLDRIYEKILAAMDEVLDVKDEYLCDFEETEEFKTLFPNMHPTGKAFKICNLDSIFANFIRTRDGIVCIDYEWVLDFPVPVNFIRFRMIQNIYNEHIEYLLNKIDMKAFLGCLELSDEELDLYENMEKAFQDSVHGPKLKYSYLENYKKNMRRLATYIEEFNEKNEHVKNLEAILKNKEELINNKDEVIKSREEIIQNKDAVIESKENQIKEREINIQNLNDQISAKETHINNLTNIIEKNQKEIEDIKEAKEQQARDYDSLLQYEIKRRDNDIIYRDGLLQIKDAQIDHLTRMTRNPLYWGYCLGRKVCKKAYRIIEPVGLKAKKEEIAKIGKYKYKYKDLMELDNTDYADWIERVEKNYPKEKRLKYHPKISVLVPVYNVLDKHLVPCIESVINQTYDNWELCLADDKSTWDNVRETLEKYEDHPKIKIVYRKENGHISEATNSALSVASGDFVGLLDCDDLLTPNALYEVALKLNENRDLDFIYSDEDKVDDDGNNRHMPHFKPDWSPDTLMSNMYTCHFTVYRKSLVEKVGGLRTECNGSQDYDLALRIMDETTPDKISHIAKILYHWREREESTSGNATVKPYVFEAAKKAKMDSLERRGLKGEAVFVDTMYQYNIVYTVKDDPKVSIVIPSKDNYEVLSRCIETLHKYTEYKNFEVILVDNGSNNENKKKYDDLCKKHGMKYFYEKMDFNFSKMCNIGAKHASGEYILLLNDDIEILAESGNWISVMLGQAQISYTGAVGAKLLYPQDRKIQHVGVINIENGPVHAFTGMSDDVIYYFGRNRLNYNVLAVTAACLLINKDKYWKVGGLDESFAVAYNDVDFCMKLSEAGYFNVVRNDITLIHHESVSRGNDLVDINKTRRLMDEENRLYDIHSIYAHNDPFYNSNLTQLRQDFSYNTEDYKMLLTKVKKYNKVIIPVEEEHLLYSIDAINIERYIYIEGWAFFKNKDDNNDNKIRIILKGDNSYIIDTYKVYRKDVAEFNNTENNIEFTGFRCRFDRREIIDGEYDVCLIVNGIYVDAEKKLIK